MAGRKPRARGSNKKPPASSRRRRQRVRSNGSGQSMAVHRRLAVYPKTSGLTWLDKLSWFGGIALKLFTMVVGVTDSLEAETKNTAAGSAIFLGPMDFAAVCASASSVYTSKDREVQALKVIPYERISLSRIQVKIVPSVDAGSRVGMYAAVLHPIDTLTLDADRGEAWYDSWTSKFNPNYDEIIRHPRAVLAPTTRSVTLNVNTGKAYRALQAAWSDAEGYHNRFPTHVLMIAFSSLAAESSRVADEYAPSRALFEVHLRGSLNLQEPCALPPVSEKPTGAPSYSTVQSRCMYE